LSLSSTNNKASPAGRAIAEYPTGGRKTSWSKRLGGMLSGLTSSNNKENAGETGSIGTKSGKTYTLGIGPESEVLGLGVPVARGRSVSEMTK
jgi:hypothetical protein